MYIPSILIYAPRSLCQPIIQKIFHSPLLPPPPPATPIKLFLKILIPPLKNGGASHYDWFQHPNRMDF